MDRCFNLSDVKFKLTEVGLAVGVLAVFIALFAVVEEFAGTWSSIVYILLLLGFTVIISLIGMMLAPRAYES